jgi:hypothetical protein
VYTLFYLIGRGQPLPNVDNSVNVVLREEIETLTQEGMPVTGRNVCSGHVLGLKGLLCQLKILFG